MLENEANRAMCVFEELFFVEVGHVLPPAGLHDI